MTELSEEIHSEIQRLCALGDKCADAKQHSDALQSYWTAWDLLPEPKNEWDAATWILAAVGDSNFLSGEFVAGRDNLSQAMLCPNAIGNPFIHLRLGQCQFELQAFDHAANELMRAYMGGGTEIFQDQDPKYIRFLQSTAQNVDAPKKSWQFWK
jgi:hypothetical protein